MRTTCPSRRGFTIVEIIVVVSIIVILIALLIPAMSRARNTANMATARAQIESIQSALQSYFTDHNMYPPSHLPTGTSYGSITPGNGSLMLAQGLMGFFPKPFDGAGPPSAGGPGTADEPLYGFRTRRQMGGKVYGPYMDPARQSYERKTPGQIEYFKDAWEHDVLYFRGRGQPTGSPPQIFDDNDNGNTAFFYNSDNLSTQKGSVDGSNPATMSLEYFKLIYPNANNSLITKNNYSNGGPVLGGESYLLISAGPDEKYFTLDDLLVTKP
jgi:prepilin-type N-terminal cleavage/methylation domain-containing protein